MLLAVAALFAPAVPAAPSANLPPAVRAALDQARIPPSAVAVWVQPLDARQPTLAVNAAQPMNPASVMKLVTTFAALEQLGPERTWTTRIAAEAPIKSGMLSGNLYLIGDGDPVLTYERLWRVLRRLRGLGLETVAGDIVLDHAALAFAPLDPNAFDGKGLRPYNSNGDGLLLHFNAQELALFPGEQAQAPVRLVAEPPLAGIRIDNRIVTSARPCEPWYRDLDARLDGNLLTLTGSLPAQCGPRIWATAPLPPREFGAALVQALWRELGGKLRGKVTHGVAPAGAKTLLTDESPPLSEIVRTMNKWSNNVIARQLIAQLGRPAPDAAAPADMLAVGIEAARQRLAEADIDIAGMVLVNGAGLSRAARIRADTLGTLLVRAWQRPWMPEFLASLPILGRDGTTRRRLVDSPARGYAHLKTGTINDVKTVAGYVLDHQGRRHAVVMLVNHPEAGKSGPSQDALLEWVWVAGARSMPLR
ncbi:MAG: D-alanyl-D-alanine carboxypeptidase/D-alanyl-D-alanine-endopeptidase [Azoarcus sp.]|nr:D-alanyl-D-alanine carboxypeptidase/D-alanyl-D-alanine-endopeptidase [Azoarcus sp.]